MVALTDSTGTVVDRYSYDAWEAPINVTEQAPSSCAMPATLISGDRTLLAAAMAEGYRSTILRHIPEPILCPIREHPWLLQSEIRLL